MSKRGGISQPMSQASSGGGTSAAELEFLESVLECLAELKLLTIANNDATALAEIIGKLSDLCEKLLAQNDQTAAICKKLEKMLSELSSLCEKIENGNEDILACLDELKLAATDTIEALEALCKKADVANESLAAICKKLDKANESLSAICDKLEKLISIASDSLDCLVDIKELLTCPPASAKGVLTSWGI